ncbi:hypothetical protein GCM10009872_54280 [Actinopolymorpha rutila]
MPAGTPTRGWRRWLTFSTVLLVALGLVGVDVPADLAGLAPAVAEAATAPAGAEYVPLASR